MGAFGPADQWRRLPLALRWVLAYGAALAACWAVGTLTPMGVGNALFVAGALAVFVSLVFIRLGGPKALVGRTMKGTPIFGLDAGKRRDEIRVGAAIFLFGMALWGALAVAWWMGVDLA